MRWFLSLALVLALAVAAFAADEVLMNSGDMIEGEIQSVDQNGIAVKTKDGKTITVAPLDLDAHYYYEQWAKRADKNAEQHLRLAVFAYENGMFNQARSQYRKAQKLDKALVKKFEEEIIPQIKEGIAKNLLDLTEKAVDAKDWNKAKRLASKILTDLEDTEAAEDARRILGSVHVWQLDKDQERLVKSLQRYLPKEEAKALQMQEKIVAKLGPIENRMRKAQDLVTKGLRTKSTNRQKGIFEQAAKRFEKVVKDLDKQSAAAGDDLALKDYIGELRATAVRDGIDAYMNAGNVYLVRGSFDQALRMANAALALDPESPQAQQFQKRVVTSAQLRSGWGRRR